MCFKLATIATKVIKVTGMTKDLCPTGQTPNIIFRPFTISFPGVNLSADEALRVAYEIIKTYQSSTFPESEA